MVDMNQMLDDLHSVNIEVVYILKAVIPNPNGVELIDVAKAHRRYFPKSYSDRFVLKMSKEKISENKLQDDSQK